MKKEIILGEGGGSSIFTVPTSRSFTRPRSNLEKKSTLFGKCTLFGFKGIIRERKPPTNGTQGLLRVLVALNPKP